MNIVIEGIDNSGKSTLARMIAQETGRTILSSTGPEKYPGEMEERAKHCLEQHNVIFDRHPCISDLIYSSARRRPTRLSQATIKAFYDTKPFFIYCTGGHGMQGHIVKAHDTASHVKMIEEHYSEILRDYNLWALDHANMIHRLNTPFSIPSLGNFDPVRDVQEFMDKFGQSYFGDPRALPEAMQRFRSDFMDEELREYKINVRDLATELEQEEPDANEVTKYLENILDAFMDKMYVDIGTALLHGFNSRIFREAWARVHSANMKKERVASRGESTRHSTFDVRKPEGWKPPSHTDLVEAHLHRK